MVATDIYEIVEEHFGEPASPDLVLKVREGRRETAVDFGRRYQEWVTTQKPRIAEKPTRQLRPFIEAAYHGPKGVSLFAPAFSNDENQLWALYDGLVHHLLYCHSVAIENPLMHLMTSSGVGRQLPFLHLQGGMFGFHVNPTIILSRYIALLVELRGLVDCGAVVIVETGPSPMSGYAPQVTVYREADPPGVGTHQFRSRPYVLSDAQAARRHPASRARGSRVGLAAPRRRHHRLHASGATADAAQGCSRQDRERGAGLRPDLAPGDIRAIRRSDETFNRWRQALGNGLGVVETLPDVPLTEEHLNTVRGEIYENIVEARLAIDTSINKSDWMKAARARRAEADRGIAAVRRGCGAGSRGACRADRWSEARHDRLQQDAAEAPRGVD